MTGRDDLWGAVATTRRPADAVSLEELKWLADIVEGKLRGLPMILPPGGERETEPYLQAVKEAVADLVQMHGARLTTGETLQMKLGGFTDSRLCGEVVCSYETLWMTLGGITASRTDQEPGLITNGLMNNWLTAARRQIAARSAP